MMPAQLSPAGRAAREYGITYHCAKYRLENGLPLDAPVKHGNPDKAWDTRGRGRKPRKAKPAWVKAIRRARNPLAVMAGDGRASTTRRKATKALLQSW